LPLDCVRAGVKNERVGGDVVKKGLREGGFQPKAPAPDHRVIIESHLEQRVRKCERKFYALRLDGLLNALKRHLLSAGEHLKRSAKYYK